MKPIVEGGAVNLSGKEHVLSPSMGGKGHYLPILEAAAGQLDAMLSYHSKVLAVRVDLHLNGYTKTNKIMSQFINKLKKKLKSRFGQDQVGYIWCREQNLAHAQHYHLALILNGNKNRHPHNIITLIEQIWTGWHLPKPYTPENCYYLVHRGDHVSYDDALRRLTYLAKVETKGNRPKATNDFSASRIKLKAV